MEISSGRKIKLYHLTQAEYRFGPQVFHFKELFVNLGSARACAGDERQGGRGGGGEEEGGRERTLE